MTKVSPLPSHQSNVQVNSIFSVGKTEWIDSERDGEYYRDDYDDDEFGVERDEKEYHNEDDDNDMARVGGAVVSRMRVDCYRWNNMALQSSLTVAFEKVCMLRYV